MGRISDGEFALLLHADARGAERVATQILARFADPFPFGDKEVIVECDIGITCYPDDGRSSESAERRPCRQTGMGGGNPTWLRKGPPNLKGRYRTSIQGVLPWFVPPAIFSMHASRR